MESDGRPTTQVVVAWCGCGGRGVHLTPPHETKTISMRFVGRGLVGMVRETMQPAHVSVWLRPATVPKGEQAE
jgi:hypothetical protein